jgi:hypothetical protein
MAGKKDHLGGRSFKRNMNLPTTGALCAIDERLDLSNIADLLKSRQLIVQL